MNIKKIFQCVAGIAAVVVIGFCFSFVASKTALAKDAYAINDSEVKKNIDELIGAFVTYDVNDTNVEQEKLNKEGKVYAQYSEKEMIFGGIKGTYLSYYGIKKDGGLDDTEDFYNDGMCGVGDEGGIVGSIYITSTCQKDVTFYINPMYKDVSGKIYITSKNAIKKTVTVDQIQNANFTTGGLALIESVELEACDFTLEDDESEAVNVHVHLQVAKSFNEVKIEALDEANKVIDTVTYNGEEADKGESKTISKAAAYRLIYSWNGAGDVFTYKEIMEEGSVWGYYGTVDYDGIIQKQIVVPSTIIK